jgi:AcrR family transcriptional regulator
MPRPKPDRDRLLAALARHVLRSGLNAASLRPMAAAAGTSDRMLIYHFGSKERLVDALLRHLAEDLARRLDPLVPARPGEGEAALLRRIVALLRSPRFRPYGRVWLDIVSAAAQGGVAQRRAGGAIIDAFLDWLALRHPAGHAGAAAALVRIEGVLVMDAVGRQAVADASLAEPDAPPPR